MRRAVPVAALQLVWLISLALLCWYVGSGCCATSRAIGGRNCYPACPALLPPTVVTVERECKLPPTLALPAITRSACPAGAAAGLVCYDVSNAMALAQRDAALKSWIREARARCDPHRPITPSLTDPNGGSP